MIFKQIFTFILFTAIQFIRFSQQQLSMDFV